MSKPNSRTNQKMTNDKFGSSAIWPVMTRRRNFCFTAIFPSAAGGKMPRPRNGLRMTLPPWAM
mgnify:CR=1 FL=1